MAQWTLLCYDGRRETLPTALEWELQYGLGTPCDSFRVKTLWTGGKEERLMAGTRMEVTQEGKRVFTGVVDRYDITWDARGKTVTLRGRSPAALLMDNESRRVTIHLPYDKGGLLDKLYLEAKVESVDYGETIEVTAVCTPRTLGQMAEYLAETEG